MSTPSTTSALEIATPQCAAEVLEDEVVVLNVETGVYFSLRGAAAALWHDLAAGHPINALTQRAPDADAVTAFAARLEQYGLMRPAPPRPAPPEITSAAWLAGAQPELIFEVYQDMQDLILSDPIHDVDQSKGWPGVEPRGG